MAKIWLIDEECPAPQGYAWAHIADEAIYEIMYREREKDFIFKRYIVDYFAHPDYKYVIVMFYCGYTFELKMYRGDRDV